MSEEGKEREREREKGRNEGNEGKINEGDGNLTTCIPTNKDDNISPASDLPQTREIEIGSPSDEIKHTQETAVSFFSRVSITKFPSV